jgi:hypothetical protein
MNDRIDYCIELIGEVERKIFKKISIMSSKRSIYEIRFTLQSQEWLIILDLHTLVQ